MGMYIWTVISVVTTVVGFLLLVYDTFFNPAVTVQKLGMDVLVIFLGVIGVIGEALKSR